MKNCFICDRENTETAGYILSRSYGFRLFDCPSCGDYGVFGNFADDFKDGRSNSRKEIFLSKARIIAVERKLAGRDKYVLTYEDVPQGLICEGSNYYWLPESDFISEYPLDNSQIFDRILLNLSRCIKHPADQINIVVSQGCSYAILYSSNTTEASFIIKQLEEMGYLDSSSSLLNEYILRITAAGWQKISNIREHNEKSESVFVAMWFSKETLQYRQAVENAVEISGYRSVIVDQEDFNDYIMDKVFNDIRDARFIIADFTCSSETDDKSSQKIKGGTRGGVYYEAGYARGLGKEVIHTCRNDDESKKRRHFDIEQINTIFWEEDTGGKVISLNSDFIDALHQRIVATVGYGPLRKKS